jgi:hypothetical protein
MTDNPCYRPGALWKTRVKLKVFPRCQTADEAVSDAGNPIQIPRGEFILILGYVMNTNYEEHIEFLWREKVYHAYQIDSGLQFYINPRSANTKKHD